MNQLSIAELAQQVNATATALRRAQLTGRDRDLARFAATTLDDVGRLLVDHQAVEHDQHRDDLDTYLARRTP